MKKVLNLIIIFIICSTLSVFASIGVTIELSETKAKSHDTIMITGTSDLNTWVSIKVLDSIGNIVYFNAVLSDSLGMYEDSFIVPDIGSETLTIVSGSGDNTSTIELEIYEPIIIPPTPKPEPNPTPEPKKNDDGSVTITVDNTEVDKQTGQTKVELSAEIVGKAFEQATENKEGKKKIELEIPEEEETEGYQVELPKSTLETDEKREIEVKTNFGSITLPGNMLSNKEYINSDKVSLSIKMADKEQLTENQRNKIGDKPVVDLELIQDGQQVNWKNRKAPVIVSIPYTPTEKELKNPERIAVWYIDGEGKVTKVRNGRYNSDTGMVEFKVKHFSTYAIVYDEITFNDLDNHLWAKHHIEILAAKGITNGTGNDNFSPQNYITRADFLTLLIRTLELDEEFETNFNDIIESDYYYEAVGIAKQLGITTGVGNNKFNPEAYITREDMMVMTKKALVIKGLLSSETDQTILDSFIDKSQISNYALNSISVLVENSLITGSNNMINPKGNTTRAQSAVVIYKIYNLD